MSVRKKDNPALYARIEEQNLLRQYDLLSNCMEIGLEKGIDAFDKYTLWALNYAAVANIAQFGGRYREDPIYVGNHVPPHFKEVRNLMDRFFSMVHENWTLQDHPTLIAANAQRGPQRGRAKAGPYIRRAQAGVRVTQECTTGRPALLKLFVTEF